MPGVVQAGSSNSPDRTPTSYEERRRLRLEQNKQRMQELGLSDLCKGLAQKAHSATKSRPSWQVKSRTVKERVLIELRRSPRISNSSVTEYREIDYELPSARKRARFALVSSCARSCLGLRKYASDEARMRAAQKAEDLEKGLTSNNASFVKMMLQSHVSGGFWLGLPALFCKTYLPHRDGMIVLEDEKGEEWETVYLSYKSGLSGGWRGFSLDHALEDGDALLFELTEHNRFKVYIVRASEGEQGTDSNEREDDSSNPIAKVEGGDKRKQKLIRLDSSDETDLGHKIEVDEQGEEVYLGHKIEADGEQEGEGKLHNENAKEEVEGESKGKSGKGMNKNNQMQLTGMLRLRKVASTTTNSAGLKKEG